jgi:hypothetical protein
MNSEKNQIKIRSIQLADGELFTHPLLADEECYYLDVTGNYWIAPYTGRKRFNLPVFEIVAYSEGGIKRFIERAAIVISRLCKKSGTVIIAVCHRDKLIAPEVCFILHSCVLFTTVDPNIETRYLDYLPDLIEASEEKLIELDAEDAAYEVHKS